MSVTLERLQEQLRVLQLVETAKALPDFIQQAEGEEIQVSFVSMGDLIQTLKQRRSLVNLRQEWNESVSLSW